MEIVSNSAQQTRKIAVDVLREQLLGTESRCIVFLLSGQLGVGKTEFTKGIAEGLGVEESITSPSYQYEREYKTSAGLLIHIDLWRVESQTQFDALQLDAHIKPRSVIVVEWPRQFLSAEQLLQVAESKSTKLIVVSVDISESSNPTEQSRVIKILVNR